MGRLPLFTVSSQVIHLLAELYLAQLRLPIHYNFIRRDTYYQAAHQFDLNRKEVDTS